MTLAHLRILVDEFDRTANTILSKFPLDADEADAISKVIDALRMVNTGNLEWRCVHCSPLAPSITSLFRLRCVNSPLSLQTNRYGVGQFMTNTGQIELVL